MPASTGPIRGAWITNTQKGEGRRDAEQLNQRASGDSDAMMRKRRNKQLESHAVRDTTYIRPREYTPDS